MTILTVGIDLAKNVLAVQVRDEHGKAALLRPVVARGKLLELIAAPPRCVIGTQACSGAHEWARQFAKFGHPVRLMAPKFVAPYRRTGRRGKNDAADSAALCEAVTPTDGERSMSAPETARDGDFAGFGACDRSADGIESADA